MNFAVGLVSFFGEKFIFSLNMTCFGGLNFAYCSCLLDKDDLFDTFIICRLRSRFSLDVNLGWLYRSFYAVLIEGVMQSFERLSPDMLLPLLQTRAEELLRAIEMTQKSLTRAPRGRLKLARRGRVFFACHVVEDKSEYIPKSNWALMSKLAQKDYDENALREMERELSLIDGFIAKYRPEELIGIYNRMNAERKSLVEPIQLSDEEYARRWLAVPYKGKGFEAEAPDLRTAKGERVRSKSEVIIADVLARLGIPYKYECPLKLADGCPTVYPDFTCLDLRTRKELLWEHLGMMDNPEYASIAVKKLSSYLQCGYVLGKNLIITMESSENPLNQNDVKRIVKEMFLH